MKGMKNIGKQALYTLPLLMCGCASTTGMLNREIQENPLMVGDAKSGSIQASVLGMSENRRGILIRDNRRPPDTPPSIYFCAEPPPDVAMSSRAGFAAGIAVAEKGNAKVVDQYSRIAMQLANRTSLLDIYRTAVFTLCQLHMNGAIRHESAEGLFREITLEVIKKAPATETPHAAANGSPDFGPDVDLPTDNTDKQEAKTPDSKTVSTPP
jgi:hypothetical protein